MENIYAHASLTIKDPEQVIYVQEQIHILPKKENKYAKDPMSSGLLSIRWLLSINEK